MKARPGPAGGVGGRGEGQMSGVGREKGKGVCTVGRGWRSLLFSLNLGRYGFIYRTKTFNYRYTNQCSGAARTQPMGRDASHRRVALWRRMPPEK